MFLRSRAVGFLLFPIHYFLVLWDFLQNPFLLKKLWLINSQPSRSVTVVRKRSGAFREAPYLLGISGRPTDVELCEYKGWKKREEVCAACLVRVSYGIIPGPQLGLRPRSDCYKKKEASFSFYAWNTVWVQ